MQYPESINFITPKLIYQQRITQDKFDHDPAQENAVEKFEELHQLLKQNLEQRDDFSNKLKRLIKKPQTPITGLYLWGGVGRGKTWLMDLFFDSLPFPKKIRLHFHRFMQAVHDQLTMLRGHRDPLVLIAKNFAKKYRILCLDEFHVSDITDAMLLYGLLDALFKEGVTLVATSNLEPDDLYKNGLQRERFVPAIELIKKHTQSVNLDGEIDHRLRILEKAETWYDALVPDIDEVLRIRFEELAPCKGQKNENLRINYRDITAKLYADDVAWFEFKTLCTGPRAAADYIEIARRFHTLFITNIPIMNEAIDDQARRFINMIDEFYDRNVKLIISAQAIPSELYTGQQLEFEFQRTISRLEEMRSHDYLCRPHKP